MLLRYSNTSYTMTEFLEVEILMLIQQDGNQSEENNYEISIDVESWIGTYIVYIFTQFRHFLPPFSILVFKHFYVKVLYYKLFLAKYTVSFWCVLSHKLYIRWPISAKHNIHIAKHNTHIKNTTNTLKTQSIQLSQNTTHTSKSQHANQIHETLI